MTTTPHDFTYLHLANRMMAVARPAPIDGTDDRLSPAELALAHTAAVLARSTRPAIER